MKKFQELKAQAQERQTAEQVRDTEREYHAGLSRSEIIASVSARRLACRKAKKSEFYNNVLERAHAEFTSLTSPYFATFDFRQKCATSLGHKLFHGLDFWAEIDAKITFYSQLDMITYDSSYINDLTAFENWLEGWKRNDDFGDIAGEVMEKSLELYDAIPLEIRAKIFTETGYIDYHADKDALKSLGKIRLSDGDSKGARATRALYCYVKYQALMSGVHFWPMANADSHRVAKFESLESTIDINDDGDIVTIADTIQANGADLTDIAESACYSDRLMKWASKNELVLCAPNSITGSYELDHANGSYLLRLAAIAIVDDENGRPNELMDIAHELGFRARRAERVVKNLLWGLNGNTRAEAIERQDNFIAKFKDELEELKISERERAEAGLDMTVRGEKYLDVDTKRVLSRIRNKVRREAAGLK